jgi:hypothetical protein
MKMTFLSVRLSLLPSAWVECDARADLAVRASVRSRSRDLEEHVATFFERPQYRGVEYGSSKASLGSGQAAAIVRIKWIFHRLPHSSCVKRSALAPRL